MNIVLYLFVGFGWGLVVGKIIYDEYQYQKIIKELYIRKYSTFLSMVTKDFMHQREVNYDLETDELSK